MSDILFHVGFPKSASTTLQNNIFLKLPDTFYLGVGTKKNKERYKNPKIPEYAKQLFFSLFKKDSLDYSREETTALWESIQKDIKSNHSIILSNEQALGTIFSIPDLVEKARRIRDIFGSIKILIVIRNQHDLALSQYRDWPYQPGNYFAGKPVSFKEWVELDNKRRHYSFLKTLYYSRILDLYETLFEKGNIIILPIELMKHEPESFNQILSNAIGVDIKNISELTSASQPLNQGVNDYQITMKHLLRQYGYLKSLKKRVPIKFRNSIKSFFSSRDKQTSEEIKKYFHDRYSEDNRFMSKRTGIDLEKLGY